jgi:hypothetical protein
VSRNKSPNLPQPPAVSTSCPSSPCCRSFHLAVPDPVGSEVDLRPSCVDQAPSGADLFPTVVSGHLPVPAASTAAFAAASPSQLPSAPKLEYSTWWSCSWYLLEEVASPWDPGVSYFINLRRCPTTSIGRRCALPTVASPAQLQPTLCAVSAWVQASLMPLRSPRRRLLRHLRHGLQHLAALCFLDFCVFRSSLEDLSVIWLL